MSRTYTVFYYEDEKIWRELYLQVMEDSGYRVHVYSNAHQAEKAIRNAEIVPDVAVLDIKDQSAKKNVGFQICREIKRKFPGVPVIFLTSYGLNSKAHLTAYECLAHHYVVKTEDDQGLFLLARIENAIALSEIQDGTAGRYTRGSLTVDLPAQTAYWKGIDTNVTITELAIVDALAYKAGERRSHEELRRAAQIKEASDEDLLWTSPEEKEQQKQALVRNTLSTHVARIRRKFSAANKEAFQRQSAEESDDESMPSVVVTERDFGYRYRKDK